MHLHNYKKIIIKLTLLVLENLDMSKLKVKVIPKILLKLWGMLILYYYYCKEF